MKEIACKHSPRLAQVSGSSLWKSICQVHGCKVKLFNTKLTLLSSSLSVCASHLSRPIMLLSAWFSLSCHPLPLSPTHHTYFNEISYSPVSIGAALLPSDRYMNVWAVWLDLAWAICTGLTVKLPVSATPYTCMYVYMYGCMYVCGWSGEVMRTSAGPLPVKSDHWSGSFEVTEQSSSQGL